MDSQRELAFLKVAAYLEENDDEQITISDLVQKMSEYCDDDAYSSVWMKKKDSGLFWEKYHHHQRQRQGQCCDFQKHSIGNTQ